MIFHIGRIFGRITQNGAIRGDEGHPAVEKLRPVIGEGVQLRRSETTALQGGDEIVRYQARFGEQFAFQLVFICLAHEVGEIDPGCEHNEQDQDHVGDGNAPTDAGEHV